MFFTVATIFFNDEQVVIFQMSISPSAFFQSTFFHKPALNPQCRQGTPARVNKASRYRPAALLLLAFALLTQPAFAENFFTQKATSEAGKPASLINGSDFLPVDKAFAFETLQQAQALQINFKVTPGHYVYRDRIHVTSSNPDIQIAPLVFLSEAERKEDPYFGEVAVYHHDFSLQVQAQLPAGLSDASLKLTYQGCADQGLCYPPQSRDILYIADQATAAAETDAPASSRPDLPGQPENASGFFGFLQGSSMLTIALVFFAAGLGLTFTPCVLPMLPIISAVVAGHASRTTLHAFLLASSYVLGMALTYAAAGVVTGLLGASFNIQAQLQSPWVLSIFAALFVLFALSMFNLYELQLPAFLRNKLTAQSQSLSGGHIFSVMGIGALSALIVSPCVSAPLAGALLYIGSTQDALLGGVALFVLGIGMGLPLILISVGGKRFLPQSGTWMNAVKATFGVMLIAVAIWLLERLLPAAVTLILWGLLLGLCGVQLGAFEAARAGWQRTWKGLGLILFIYATLLFTGALTGADDPLKPLSAFARQAYGDASATTPANETGFTQISSSQELTLQLAAAQVEGKPVMLDFYADWCISCKVMDREVFQHAGVQNRLASYIRLQLDVTDNTPDQQALLTKLGLFGPPAILFFDRHGQEMTTKRILGEMDRQQFMAHLNGVESEMSLAYNINIGRF